MAYNVSMVILDQIYLLLLAVIVKPFLEWFVAFAIDLLNKRFKKQPVEKRKPQIFFIDLAPPMTLQDALD